MEELNWKNMIPIEDAALKVTAAFASNPSVTDSERVIEMYKKMVKKILDVRDFYAEKKWYGQ